MRKLIHRVLHLITPPIVFSVIKRLRYRKSVPSASPRYAAFNALNQNLAANEIILREGIQLSVHPESKSSFEYFCHKSEEMCREFDNFLELTADRKSLLDIGALHGVFSLAFTRLNPIRSALAVDASPIAFSKLLYNVYKNPECNITTVEQAVSDKQGILCMHYEWEHAVATSHLHEKNKLTVASSTGDEICARHRFSPDTIKIDVEGHEVSVLMGMSDLIKTSRPIIFLEVHPERIAQSGKTMNDLLALIDAYDLEITGIDKSLVSRETFIAFSNDQRVVLLPRSRR